MEAGSERDEKRPTERGRESKPHSSNNFNFIRLVLASSVIVSHSAEFIAGGSREFDPLNRIFGTDFSLGDLAVNAFYVLSGYLIVKSWMSQPQPWPFLKKRILRIYPAFIIASLLSEYVFGPMGHNPNYWATYSRWAVLRRIIFIGLPGEPNAFPHLTVHEVNGALWTIRYEFICYLGVILMGLLGLFRHRRAVVMIWLAFFAYFVIQTTTGSNTITGFTGKLSDILGPCLRAFTMFLAGACHYLFADQIRYSRKGVIICLIALIPCMFQYTTGAIAQAVFGSYLILALAFVPAPLLRNFGKGADISYGVYIYGWAVQQIILNRFPQIGYFSLTFSALLATFVAGWLSWHLIEQPFLRLKPRPSVGKAKAAADVLITPTIVGERL